MLAGPAIRYRWLVSALHKFSDLRSNYKEGRLGHIQTNFTMLRLNHDQLKNCAYT